jgi:hypothetical protein
VKPVEIVYKTYDDGIGENPAEISVMKQLFDQYEKDTITEEQIQRVLAPVLQMIREGKFSRRRRFQRVRKIGAGVAVCSAAIVTLVINRMPPKVLVNIPDESVPLADTTVAAGSLSGKVTLEGKGINGVVLTLVDTDSGGVTEAVTNGDGEYAFEELPDGRYRLEVEPPSGMLLEGGDDSLIFAMTGQEDLKGVDIRLCIARG